MSLVRSSAVAAIVAVAIVSLSPAAQARHYRHARALTVGYLPAHQRPDWVGLAGVPLPGLVDLGLGPVFPFGGWPNRL